jgi:hypothetical protein
MLKADATTLMFEIWWKSSCAGTRYGEALLPASAPAGALGWLRKHGTSETAGACGSLLGGGVETLCVFLLFS